ncbi:hypothetical protein MKX01_014770 [Papaver californicum]|nr:hypothetical protein MKX01_014770 [Papaver californicum]
MNTIWFTNQVEGIDSNNSQGFSLDFPILDSENRLISQELNLIDSFNVGSSSSTDKIDEEAELKQADEGLIRVYSCNYCRRKIFSWQALESRDRLHRITAAAASFCYASMRNHQRPYNHHNVLSTSIASLPHGSLNVQAHDSAFNKPTSSSLLPTSSHYNLYGQHHHERLLSSRFPIMGQCNSLTVGYLVVVLHSKVVMMVLVSRVVQMRRVLIWLLSPKLKFTEIRVSLI